MQRIECRGQNLDGGVPGQPDGIAGERQRGLARIGQMERPALVNRGDHRLPQHGQSHRRWHGEQKYQAQRAAQSAAELLHGAGRRAARDGGQRGRGDGHPEQSQRQLHEAKRIEKPTHRTVHHVAGRVGNAGGEGGIHKYVHLHGGVAEDGRTHQGEDAPQTGMRPIQGGPEHESAAGEAGNLAQQLHGATEDDSIGHAHNGLNAEIRSGPEAGRESEQQRSDVKESRRQRGHAEAVVGIQNSHCLGGQRHQQQEREHGASERGGELGLAGHLGEFSREQLDQLRAPNHTRRADRAHGQQQDGGHKVREVGSLPLSLGGQVGGEGGDKGGRQRALGEQIACEVGNAKADDKRVIGHAGAEQPGHGDLTSQSGEAAEEDRRRHHAGRAHHIVLRRRAGIDAGRVHDGFLRRPRFNQLVNLPAGLPRLGFSS